jgi:3-oxoacyl-[acyl-carrier-protein] synthase II
MPEARRRAVVTGIGPVTPIGTGVTEYWTGLTEGRSGASTLTGFDTANLPCRIGAQIHDFSIDPWLDARSARRLQRFSQLAQAAARLALEHAHLSPTEVDPARVGIVIGSGIGGISLYEEEHRKFLEKGPRVVNPALIAMMIPNAASGALAIELGFTGPNDCTVTACASSGHAIARAVEWIRNGSADIVLAGGSEACISAMTVASFCQARALTTRNDEPERASRPFDADRDGFLFAEGATVLVLEAADVAEGRGATPLAEVLGCGLSSDAHHLIAPHPDGLGASAAMHAALQDAGVTPSDIGYINAHGTSTQLGDVAEVRAIHKVFGSSPPPTSSTKSMTGHMLGAAGATEAAAVILGINAGMLPPTINYDTPDPECDIDVVPNTARTEAFELGMSNSFGFGGQNSSIVLGRA